MNEEIVLEHKGFLNYNLLNKLLGDFIVYVEKNRIDNYLFKKVQIVMVEMLENNYQYMENLGKESVVHTVSPEFKIIKTGNGFKLTASNPVQVKDVNQLRTMIEEINRCDLKKIKELYKNTLKEGMYSEKKTAGTGLLRIAKVTKNKIVYSFRKVDNKLLNYTLEIMINSK